MKPTRHTCLLLFCFLINFVIKAQDVHFSQFYMTPLLLNPAEAGARHDMQGVLNYRNQWSSVSNPYTTANLSWDMRLGKNREKGYSAIGLNINQDKTGFAPLKTFQLSLTYAYHVKLNEKSTLGAGLYGGFMQRSISNSNVQWMNQYDGMAYNAALPSSEPSVSNSMMSPDFGAGLHYGYSKNEKYMTGNDHRKFHMGVSVFHVNQPAYSFYGTGEKLFIKATAYANAEIGLPNSDVSLVPGVVYSIQGPSQELLAGGMLQYKLKGDSKYTGYVQGSAISLGAYYRNKDAVVASFLYKFSQYAIGVSYDLNVSKLKSASNGRGGIEISLRYTNPSPFLYKKNASSI
jgi:type IX secretion system PorP/SprF family membrane protein